MCGIIGFITNEKVRGAGDRRKFIEQALIADTVRGDDSTGIFIVGHKMDDGEQADWFKQAADGYTFISQADYQTRMAHNNVSDYRAVIGHNRSATVGTINVDNAHPFQEGPITLVHNGTLWTTHGLDTPLWKLKDKGIEVDSHAICHNLAEAGDPADVISKLDGAFALVWHDARDNCIRIIRNDKRPLHLLFSKCEDTVLIASEAEMLAWLAKRNSFQFDNVVTPKPGQLLTFQPGNLVPEVREVPFFQPPTRGWERSGGRGRWDTGTTTGTTSRRHLPPWQNERVPLAAEEALLELDLDCETDLKFVPTRVTEVHGLDTAVVSGILAHPDGLAPLTGVVTGLLFSQVELAPARDETWTVRARVVKQVEDAGPTVICRLVSRKWDEPALPSAGANRYGTRTPHEYIPGPHDEWIPVYEWINHTADGCIQCGMPLCADDAEEIAWVQGQSRPICPACLEDNHRINAIH